MARPGPPVGVEGRRAGCAPASRPGRQSLHRGRNLAARAAKDLPNNDCRAPRVGAAGAARPPRALLTNRDACITTPAARCHAAAWVPRAMQT
eukprot:6157568-Lingulodinium_polyedra.AAC.1